MIKRIAIAIGISVIITSAIIFVLVFFYPVVITSAIIFVLVFFYPGSDLKQGLVLSAYQEAPIGGIFL
jgi:hypothetical protein